MPFNSETGRLAGSKSKRGKAKHSSELRSKICEITNDLIESIEIEELSTNDRIALLRILMNYSIPKLKDENEEKTESSEYTIHIVG